jgi:hypothetical protein
MKRSPRKKTVAARGSEPKNGRLYTLDVHLFSGPMTESFVKKNPKICRMIEIGGGLMLTDLHDVIFAAFDREEEHLYEFQIGGKGPMDPEARRYMPDMDTGLGLPGPEVDGDAARTTIDSLKLKRGDVFGYWFDFGDDWRHRIDIVSVEEETGSKRSPRIVKRVGKSPPQYARWR